MLSSSIKSGGGASRAFFLAFMAVFLSGQLKRDRKWGEREGDRHAGWNRSRVQVLFMGHLLYQDPVQQILFEDVL